MQDFYISPFVVVEYIDNIKLYRVSNKMYNTEGIYIKDFSELCINNKTINNRIFISVENMRHEKEKGYRVLENTFKRSPNTIGYIETTIKCPYKCIMCPRGQDLVFREKEDMPIEQFKKIVEQLKFQKDIALHLFGDPLLDKTIYEKIEILNLHDIRPSFSTNLITLNLLNVKLLKTVKLNTLIISLDSINEIELSKIRGKTYQQEIDSGLRMLLRIIKMNEKDKFINKIIIQAIQLEINKETRDRIKKMDFYSSKVVYYEKPFINFPMVNIESSPIYQMNDKVWIYNLLHRKLPFKCLKVWNKSEYAINSDGDMVACCLSFNDKVQLGNCYKSSINELFESEKQREFRRKIYNSELIGEICDNCTVDKQKFYLKNLRKNTVQGLEKYCIENWSQF